MKKKPVLITILIAVTVLIVMLAVWGKQYYEDRYVGLDYYTMIPLDYDMSSETIHDMSGNEMGTGINYKLTAYDKQGESKEVEFTVDDPDSEYSLGETQPQPGEFLLVSASKQIVLRWSKIGKDSIPKNILEIIEKK